MSFKRRFFLSIILNIALFSTFLYIPSKLTGYYGLFLILYSFAGIFSLVCILRMKPYSRKVINVIVLIISVCLTLFLFDLISRPLLRDTLYYRPDDMFYLLWPGRFEKNVSYEGEIFGDLAAMSGVKNYRETRRTVFKTDSFGFRTDKIATEDVLDVIILGDSFGAGTDTSQEKILGSLLTGKYGFKTYNLSIPNSSPWHELMDLKTELKRLRTKPGTVVLWTIFTGNDLDEEYSDVMEPYHPQDPFKYLYLNLINYKSHSPIQRLLTHYTFFKPLPFTEYETPERVFARDFLNKKKILFYHNYEQRRKRTIVDILRHHNFKKLNRVFDEMKRFAGSEDLTVAVVLIPSKEEVYSWVIDGGRPWSSDTKPSPFSVAVSELGRAEGFYCLDLKPFLISESKRLYDDSGEILWWYDDTHWNGRGHAAAASIIYENLLLPIKNKQ